MSENDIYWKYQWRYEQIDFKFCPRCGSKLDLRDIHIANQPQLICDNCQFIFYLDPKLVVTATVVQNNSVLLLKRAEEPSVGLWGLPGGHTQRGRSVVETIRNEVLEETGLTVDPTDVVDFYDLPGNQGVQITFLAKVSDGKLRTNIESKEGRFFKFTEIPWDELAFEATRNALNKIINS